LATDSFHPSATIRYEKVSTNSLFSISQAGEVSLTGSVDADEDPVSYSVVIRVSTSIDRSRQFKSKEYFTEI